MPSLYEGKRILPTDIMGGLGNSTGNIYYVVKASDSWYGHFYNNVFQEYADGSVSVYNAIQDAVDTAIAERGDIIIVGPGKWTEEVYVVDKERVRIIGVGYGSGDTGCRMRPSDASTHYPFTTTLSTALNGAAFHVLSRGVEISGFYLDGGGGYGGVYLGGGLYGGISGYTTENASGCWIHHNSIRGGSEGQVGLFMDGARFENIVEHNIFERWTGASIEMGPGNASNECSIIRANHFIADDGGYGIDIYGGANSAISCHIHGNVFADRASHAFAYAIYNRSGSTGVLIVTGNYLACANKLNLLATDYHCGNFSGTASATEVYVTES